MTLQSKKPGLFENRLSIKRSKDNDLLTTMQGIQPRDLIWNIVLSVRRPFYDIYNVPVQYEANNRISSANITSNTLMRIYGKVFKGPGLNTIDGRAKFFNVGVSELEDIETAIENLVAGKTKNFNQIAIKIGIQQVKSVGHISLPKLHHHWKENDIKIFEIFADWQ